MVVLVQEVRVVMVEVMELPMVQEVLVEDQMETMEIMVQLEVVEEVLGSLVKGQVVHIVETLEVMEQVVLEDKMDTQALDLQLVEVEQWEEVEVDQKMILDNLELVVEKVM